MRKKSQSVDHGFWELKWLLRQRLIRMIEPATAVDLFAGEGKLLADLYTSFPEIHAVEKDPVKWARLMRRIGAFGPQPGPGPRIHAYCQDNFAFAQNRLARIPGINFLDFDAYGNPHGLIQETFKVWKPQGRTAIAVTDGGRLAQVRGGGFDFAAYRPPGPGENRVPGRVRCRPLTSFEYELMVRGFWEALARQRDLRVVDYISMWRKGRRVLYYGVCVEPGGGGMD